MANRCRRRSGKAALLVIVAVCIPGPAIPANEAFAAAAEQQSSPPVARFSLVGTWVLLSTEDPSVEDPSRLVGNSVKTITSTGFVLTRTNPENGNVLFHHGGRYTFDGTDYREKIEFANDSNRSLIGRTFRFRVEIEADANTFRQVGIGNRWTETWKRLIASDASSHVPIQALACEPSPEGRSALVELNRSAGYGLETRVQTAVSALVAAAKKNAALATSYLDLARCYYTLRRRSDAAIALARALELIQKERAAQTSKEPLRSVITKPAKVRDIPPDYPEDAAMTRVTGVVIIEASVDRSGRVAAARVIRSVPMLDAPALQAVRQWEYAPAVSGELTERAVIVTTTFRAPTPADGIDVARFFANRSQYAESEEALRSALALLNAEIQRATPSRSELVPAEYEL